METKDSTGITAREFEYPYDEAIADIENWRKTVGNFPDIPQAYFLHKGDLLFLINELLNIDDKALGIRCYISRNEETNHNHLLMVGVVEDEDKIKYPNGRDVYFEGTPSKIYDLTRPCPNMCDEHSKLFEAGIYKQKVALADLKPSNKEA